MADHAMPEEKIHTRIWAEEPEEDNPFSARRCFCSGYDVYGELLGKASWFEYLFLLFQLERPLPWQTQLLQKVAIAIANPGIRDYSVRAAMNAGVGGSTSASSLMAALAVGAGQYTGSREVYTLMHWWNDCNQDLSVWQERIKSTPPSTKADIWLPLEHTPGFDPHGASCSLPVLQTLECLVDVHPSGNLAWLQQHRKELEAYANSPLAMSGVVATAFADLDFSADQGEMLMLLLRLPGAAVHALEQREYGWRKYPFFGHAVKLTNDPGPQE